MDLRSRIGNGGRPEPSIVLDTAEPLRATSTSQLRRHARPKRTRPKPNACRGLSPTGGSNPIQEPSSPLNPAPHANVSRYPFRPWDVIVALALLAITYASVSRQIRIGPVWLLPVLVIVLLIALAIAHRNKQRTGTRLLALALAATGIMAVAASTALLVSRLLVGNVDAPYLLRDAALLWIANVIVFALWYWELDGGGPRQRHFAGYTPTDLAFPQTALDRSFSEGWMPQFTDYLFVSFTASAAFSPTDTLFLSVRAKVLMMLQAMGSIVILAVVAARAINILK